MDSNKLIENIEKFMIRNNQTYFGYAWRENICNFLETETKYEKLLFWINKEIKTYGTEMNLFNPSDKFDKYPISFFNTYKNACCNLTMLLNFKYIIMDERCTTEMRENIEESICKIYNISYDPITCSYDTFMVISK
jgi:hypothetical protein